MNKQLKITELVSMCTLRNHINMLVTGPNKTWMNKEDQKKLAKYCETLDQDVCKGTLDIINNPTKYTDSVESITSAFDKLSNLFSNKATELKQTDKPEKLFDIDFPSLRSIKEDEKLIIKSEIKLGEITKVDDEFELVDVTLSNKLVLEVPQELLLVNLTDKLSVGQKVSIEYSVMEDGTFDVLSAKVLAVPLELVKDDEAVEKERLAKIARLKANIALIENEDTEEDLT